VKGENKQNTQLTYGIRPDIESPTFVESKRSYNCVIAIAVHPKCVFVKGSGESDSYQGLKFT